MPGVSPKPKEKVKNMIRSLGMFTEIKIQSKILSMPAFSILIMVVYISFDSL